MLWITEHKQYQESALDTIPHPNNSQCFAHRCLVVGHFGPLGHDSCPSVLDLRIATLVDISCIYSIFVVYMWWCTQWQKASKKENLFTSCSNIPLLVQEKMIQWCLAARCCELDSGNFGIQSWTSVNVPPMCPNAQHVAAQRKLNRRLPHRHIYLMLPKKTVSHWWR